MIRRSTILAIAASLGAAACVHRDPEPAAQPVPAEALTNEATIRARCVDPDGVIAHRVFCVLKDIPRDAVVRMP